MSYLVLTSEQADQVSSHDPDSPSRLSPVTLTDGRQVLGSDILPELEPGGVFASYGATLPWLVQLEPVEINRDLFRTQTI